MSFYVGQKVVCVDDSPGWLSGAVLKRGTVYVVRDVFIALLSKRLTICVIGHHSPTHHITGLEIGWDASRFRPLEEMKREAQERQRQSQPATQEASAK